jgi:hypothetical protein
MFGSHRPCRLLFAIMLAGMTLVGVAGCRLIIPDVSRQPVIHNPFPQLSRVAVAPFFNQSDEKTVDGRDFAMAYYAELQAVPGFEVVPLGVVEEAIIRNHINLSSPSEARRLAQVLNVDAVVIGAVTDYSPYYPPRCGLRVEWYAANPGYHEIPPGYGLPWGTPQEEYIPAPLVFEAEMALARAQLATQSPACDGPPSAQPGQLMSVPGTGGPHLEPTPPATGFNPMEGSRFGAPSVDGQPSDANKRPEETLPSPRSATRRTPKKNIRLVSNETNAGGANTASGAENSNAPDADPAPAMPPGMPLADMAGTPGIPGASGTTGAIVAGGALPPNWPDERGFIPPGPSPVRPPCIPNNGPIITHTRLYQGNDSEFTEALASYVNFREDARFGGWQNYLQRSDDFIRFCCHMHISEMLSARGGAGETRVVWQWPDSR